MKLGEKFGTARQATDDNKITRMRFVCRINKATDTDLEYVIFIVFEQQQRIGERGLIPILRLYLHYLSC
jgi:hypothetical protein